MHQFTIIGTLRVRMVIFNHRLRTHTHTHILFSVVSRPPEVPSGPSNLRQDTPRGMRATYMHWHSATCRLTHRHTLTHKHTHQCARHQLQWLEVSLKSQFMRSNFHPKVVLPNVVRAKCISGAGYGTRSHSHTVKLAHGFDFTPPVSQRYASLYPLYAVPSFCPSSGSLDVP